MFYYYITFRVVILLAVSIAFVNADYINYIRGKAGLSDLILSQSLQTTSASKATIVTNNKVSSISATQMAKKSGYLSYVSQSISTKEDSMQNSIDALMSRVYDRFRILDFTINQVGYANKDNIYVYSFGNSILDDYCAYNFNIEDNQKYYRCGSFNQNKVSLKALKSAKETIAQEQPDYIIWPCNGCRVQPYKEASIPIKPPHRFIGGYPISFGLNPYKQLPQNVIIKLYDNHGKKVPLQKNHEQYRIGEYAVYPKDRLKFNTKYKIVVLVTYLKDKKKHISYFTTTGPNTKIYRAGTHIKIKNQAKFAVYFPPKDGFNGLDTITYQTNKYVKQTTMKWYDPNTIIVDLKCNDLGEIAIQNSYNQEFKLVVNSGKKNAKTDMSLRPKIGERFNLHKGFDIKQTKDSLVIYTQYKLLFDQDTLKSPYIIKLDFDYPYMLTYTQKYLRKNIDNVDIKTNGDFTRISITLLKKRIYEIKKIIGGYEIKSSYNVSTKKH